MIDLSPILVDSPITAPEPTITWSPISTLSEILQKELMDLLSLVLMQFLHFQEKVVVDFLATRKGIVKGHVRYYVPQRSLGEKLN